MTDPPMRSDRSTTSGFSPAFARYVAATSPLTPAPMMTTSVITSMFLQYPERRISPGRAHDAAAGMRGGSAHIEIADRRRVLGPPGRRTQEEQLFEGELSLEDIAFGEAPFSLEIERRHHLPMQNDVLDVRRVLRQRIDDGVAERLALVVPRAGLQL